MEHKERINAADASFRPRSSGADRSLVGEEIGQFYFIYILFVCFLIADCCLVMLSPPKVGRLSEVSAQLLGDNPTVRFVIPAAL